MIYIASFINYDLYDEKNHFVCCFVFSLIISFYFFERSLFCSPRLHLYDKKYSKNSEILLQFICFLSIYCQMSFISVMRRWIFSIITPVFSVTCSSEIIIICWFAAQETFLNMINVKNCFAVEYFCGNGHTFDFSGFTNEQSLKEWHSFEI